jgi:hypothetical protein
MAKSIATKKNAAKKAAKKAAPKGMSQRAHSALDTMVASADKAHIIKVCFVPGKGFGPWPECQK